MGASCLLAWRRLEGLLELDLPGVGYRGPVVRTRGSGLMCGASSLIRVLGQPSVNGELTESSILGGGAGVTSRPDVFFCLPGASQHLS